MKIKNLYVGSIYRLIEREFTLSFTECGYIDTLKKDRVTILLQKKNRKVKDILFGGNYSLDDEKIELYDFVAGGLEPILPVLVKNGYDKENISKRQLLKILSRQDIKIEDK